jgi:MFS family permease
MVDYIFFGVAFSFADPSTVMASFVGMLTDSEPLIGLVGTLFAAGWLLPQLGIATFLARKPRKKPYLVFAIYAGRPLLVLVALAIWLGLTRYPATMLTAFFTLLGLFAVLDGIASVAWFDILGRAIPMTRRGRLIGAAQLISGVLGIGAGRLVEVVLGHPALPFPINYALLFTISAVLHAPSVVALTLLKEPEEDAPVKTERLSLREQLAELRTVWNGDSSFRQLMVSRWLTGLRELAISFYVVHAWEMFGLPQGRLIAARMAGGIVASLGLAWLSERRGPLPVVRLGSAAAVISPVLALGVHFLGPVLGNQADLVYLVIYFSLGFSLGSHMLGYFNCLLDMAPNGRRPLYIGLSNTLSGLLVPASFLGGVLLRATSYPALFAITSVCAIGGLVASLRLRLE